MGTFLCVLESGVCTGFEMSRRPSKEQHSVNLMGRRTLEK